MRRHLLLACVALAFLAGNGALHADFAAPPASIEVAAVAPGRAKVTFAHQPARVESAVFLAGEFNGWNPNATRMERMGDGFCRATVELSDGRYEYKFVVDGKWIADPDNPEKVPDGHDGFNSVLVLGKSAGEMPTEQRVVEGFVTPDWARDAVWYQIMLDRFANGDASNDPPNTRPWQSAWTALSPWESQGGQTFWEYAVFNRHYGGDLAGLRARIPYLKSLGVNAIYLNPVFEAPSPHKYDAATFVHIDDNFGAKDGVAPEDLRDPRTWTLNASDRVFLAVLAECKAAGLRVIVDGVFNHVGDRHVAFLDVRENGAKSRYADWFRVRSFEPFAYDGWAGFGQLPEFAKSQTGFASDAVRDHIFAVTRRWMDPNGDGDPSDGIDGWRLDVPNEVPAQFWREWRALVKKINPDAYIVGEIWKRADGWLDGTTFDAVMNYQFAQAVVQWAAGEIKPSELDRRLAAVRLAYPEQATAVLQNLLDSHDTDRLVSMIANPGRGYDRGNSERPGSSYKGAKPSDEAYRRALLAVAVQMTYVGAPMIWYGDEVGMWGSDDPFCRKPMLWADLPPNEDPSERIRAGQLDAYRALISLRNDKPALRRGAFKTLVADDARNLWVFERRLGDEVVIVALNGSREPVAGVEIAGPSETLFVTDGGAGTGGDDARTVPAFGVRIMRVP